MKKLFFILSLLTFALPLCAQELTTLGASNITRTAATLWGNLSAGSGSVVTAYWGRASAGTNAGAWANSFSLADTETGLFSTRPATLTPAALYYFNFSGTLTGRTAWATAQSFTTLAGAPTSTPVIVWTNLPSGGVTNTVTNTVEVMPGYLSATQTFSVGDADTNLTINATNGVSVFVDATAALSANRALTLDLASQGATNLPLSLFVVAQATIAPSYSTNIVEAPGPELITVTGAGSTDINGSYTWDPTLAWSYTVGAYTNESGYEVDFWTQDNNWYIFNAAHDAVYYRDHSDTVTNVWTNLEEDGCVGLSDPPTIVYSGATQYTTNIVTAYTTNAFSLALSSNCWSAGGIAPDLTNAVELTTNQFNCILRAGRVEVSPNLLNLQPVTP